MKRLLFLIVLFVGSAVWAQAPDSEAVKKAKAEYEATQYESSSSSSDEKVIQAQNQHIQYKLMTGEIYKIYVKSGDGVTTVMFPSKITEISGRNISLDGKGTDFLISAKPGSYYFSVSALAKGRHTTLTVNYNRQLYILYLIQDDQQAFASVVFGRHGGRSGNLSGTIPVTETPQVSPARLVSLIDVSKTYDSLMVDYPDTLAGTVRQKFNSVYYCGSYNMILEEVTRFDKEDTLIFKVLMQNLSDEEILYDKTSFSAHAGDSIYYMSVSDASGILPPKSSTYVWFGITSTPRGGRNNLLPQNEWLIAVSTKKQELENITAAEVSVGQHRAEIDE